MSPTMITYLKKQAELVKRLVDKDGGFDIVSTGEFLMSMRQMGYKATFNAIAELIDNSIEAHANQIKIMIKAQRHSGKGKASVGEIAIIDNGAGMEPNMIRAALQWGGTHRFDERSGIGRFGIGLPGASGSLTKTYSVYSKLKNEEWHAVDMDLDSLNKDSYKKGRVQVPEARIAKLPKWLLNYPDLDLSSGTIVLIKSPDLLTPGYYLPNSFIKNMAKQIGIIYRNFLASCNIELIEYIDSAKDIKKAYGSKTKVEPLDPLFLTEGALYYDLDDNDHIAESFKPMKIGINHNGSEHYVKLRFAHFNPNFFQKKYGGANERLAIAKQYNSHLLVCRNGRQMNAIKSAHYPNKKFNTTLLTYDRNWMIELDFPAGLDELFNVTANKQSVTPSEKIWEILEKSGVPQNAKEMRHIVDDMRTIEEAQTSRDTDIKSEYGVPTATIMQKANKFDSPALYPKDVVDSIRGEVEEKKSALIDEGMDEKEATKKAKDNTSLGFDYKFDKRGDSTSFYKPELKGANIVINFNPDHPFFTSLYSSASSEVQKSIRLMLMAMGKAEIMAKGHTDREIWYKKERQIWSEYLYNLFTIKEELEPPPEKSTESDNPHDVELTQKKKQNA